MSIAYLACPYTDPDPRVKEMRLLLVTRVAFDLMRQGVMVYSPLTHNVPIDQLGMHGNWVTWKDFDHGMLRRCDRIIVLRLPGWEKSPGVAAEIACAKEQGLPVEWMDLPAEKIQQVAKLAASPFKELLNRMLHCFEAREWGQFHSPKNLIMNVSVEVGELMEHFRWMTESQSYAPPADTLNEIRDEIGDVMITFLHLAHTLGIDPVQAAQDKLTKLEKRYPVEKCRGRADKYTAYAEA